MFNMVVEVVKNADLHAQVEQDLDDAIEFIAHRDLDESYDWFRES